MTKGVKGAKEKVPCDCTIEQLMADFEEARNKFPGKPIYWGYLPFGETRGFAFCKRHQLYCGITHDARLGVK